ncbi:MAG: hypothetical protein QOD83_4041, partial [Solirubrobacteraceae bacterium]|nr:hypothetical protein [Solirubrobacteraceae bacterium]
MSKGWHCSPSFDDVRSARPVGDELLAAALAEAVAVGRGKTAAGTGFTARRLADE